MLIFEVKTHLMQLAVQTILK